MPRLEGFQHHCRFLPPKVRVEGRPQPTLCKHGGEAEPGTRTYTGIASAFGLAMTGDCFARNDGGLLPAT